MTARENVDVLAQPLALSADNCVFSIDVEDWYHIMDLPTAPKLERWGGLPSRVEDNFIRLLDMLDERGVKATCFFLGWVAERFPSVVRQAVARGHEIASHGYAHELIYEMSPEPFLADIRRAKALLEDLAGRPVDGYRAPGFSVTAQTPWFFEQLARAGYRYSSSIFPTTRLHGGFAGFSPKPCKIETASGSIYEIPISLARIFRRRMCFFGGGYLRLFPYYLIRAMARQVLAERRPVVFYIHPREIDPHHPRLSMPLTRRIKSYIGLHSTEGKLRALFQDFTFVPFNKLLSESVRESRR
jgi:polysaccharide deacetylase family protein (PEP-CTERM system associated)